MSFGLKVWHGFVSEKIALYALRPSLESGRLPSSDTLVPQAIALRMLISREERVGASGSSSASLKARSISPGCIIESVSLLPFVGERGGLARTYPLCPKVLLGKPVVKGTRLSVEFLLELFAAGCTEQQVLDNYPTITHEPIVRGGVRCSIHRRVFSRCRGYLGSGADRQRRANGADLRPRLWRTGLLVGPANLRRSGVLSLVIRGSRGACGAPTLTIAHDRLIRGGQVHGRRTGAPASHYLFSVPSVSMRPSRIA